jgi:hypothetical protein
MPAKSVFISHTTRDDAQVKELRNNLELLDLVIWTDSENLTAGANLTKEIERNIENADALVAAADPQRFEVRMGAAGNQTRPQVRETNHSPCSGRMSNR